MQWLRETDPPAFDALERVKSSFAALLNPLRAQPPPPPPPPTLRSLVFPEGAPEGADEVVALLFGMLALRPDHRFSARGALEHPFFKPLREGPHAAAYAAELAETEAAAKRVVEPDELHQRGFDDPTERDLRAMMVAEEAAWRAKTP